MGTYLVFLAADVFLVQGYTELTIVPQTSQLKSIHLHCRQCEITKVTVASQVADYVHYDPLAHITSSNPSDVHLYPEIKRKLYSALSEGDEGELSIGVPTDVIARQVTAFATASTEDTENPNAQQPSAEAVSLTVRIEYSVRNPADGLEFVLPSETYPFRVPHMFTTPSSPDAARCWVPCVDNLWERCTWDLQFVVPRFLDSRSDAIDAAEEGNYPVVVVASGELVEQVAHPYNSSKKIFVFTQSVLTSVQHIAFAAGPFHVLELPVDQPIGEVDKDEDEESTQPQMHMFCLPGLEPLLNTTTNFYRSAMKFYSTLGSYPFGSFKAVFVDELPTKRFDSATLAIVSNDMLHGEDAIEQIFESRHLLAHALACQWVGINILPKTWSDLWLVNGLGLYITGLFFRQVFGNNEYRFRLKKDIGRIVQLDMGTQPPICQPTVFEPPDASTLSFVNLKAPAVLYILDRHLGKSGTSHGLSRVIPKIFLTAISGDLYGNALSTTSFLRTCRKISGVDPRIFAEQWIYGSGCPHFTFNANFNRKKLVVEFMMRQVCPAFEANKGNPTAMALLKPVPFFEGTITVRIHEADGTPYEHVLDIRSPQKHYEVLFNTKYKRVRRNTKRYISRKAAALAAAAGDQEAAEDIGLLDEAFGLGLWEDETERTKWRVTDWTEEDEQRMATATYEWIRMDADFEWIAEIMFDQPDFMWVSQLQRDKDVVAQIEALHALARQPSNITSSFLTHTVLVPNYFYRIRMEAAMLLIRCAVPELNHVGIFHLLKLFTAYCFQPQQKKHEFSTRFVPRPNDFTNVQEYFVRKSIISSLSQFHYSADMDYIVPRFLIDQLKYNDNTTNPYSDGLYISTLIAAVGASLLPIVTPEQSQLIATTQAPQEKTQAAELLKAAAMEVERYREMDRLVPSLHNVVSIAALEWNLMLMMGNMIPNDGNIFLKYTREGNYTGVRIAAFDGLLLMKWYTSKTLIRYIMSVIANDSSRIIRRHVARGACESLGILFAIGDIPWAGSKAQDILIEEDGSTPVAEKKNPRKKELETMTKSIRSGAGRAASLRECIMPIILAPDTDIQVRSCMLKLCDLLYRPTEESAPTLKITLPPTPIAEVPPAIPSPSIPINVPPKLKASRRSMSSFSAPYPPSPSPTATTFMPRLKLSTKSFDARSPMSVSTPILPDAQAMPPPPLPVHVVEPLPPAPAPVAPPPRPRPVAAPTPAPESPRLAKKKDKHPPKSQTSGMPLTDLRMCRNTTKKLLGYKHSLLFRQPVDPVRDRAPGYFELIKNPMDLSTMGAKLEAGAYPDRFAFENDFRLMIKNAQMYNAPGTYAYNESRALDDFFEKQWEKAIKALEEAVVKAGRSAPPRAELADDMATAALALEVEPVSEQERIAQEAADLLTALVEPTPAPPPPPPVASSSSKQLKLRISSSSVTPRQTPPPFQTPAAPTPTPTPKPRQPSSLPLFPSKEKKPTPSPAPAPVPKPPKAAKPPKLVVAPSKKPEAIIAVASDEDILFAELDKIEAERTHTPSPKKKMKERSRAATEISEDWLLGESPQVERKKGKEKAERQDRPEKVEKIKSLSRPPPAPEPSTHSSSRLSSTPSIPGPSKKGSLPVPAAAAPVKLKVKSKEATPVASSTKGTPIDISKCKAAIAKIKKDQYNSVPFLLPVDAIAQGCPTYYDEIKNPMDLSTLENNLNAGRYQTMEHFEHDIRLIFKNCRQFNPPGTVIVAAADTLEGIFNKEWAKAMEKKLASADRAVAIKILNNIINDVAGYFFRTPVDPVALGIPHYFQVIRQEDARDLRTIKQNVQAGKYESFEQIEADIMLMVSNAVKFNGEGSLVAQSAQKVGKMWHAAITKKKKEDSKRAASGHESGSEPPAKKLKLG